MSIPKTIVPPSKTASKGLLPWMVVLPLFLVTSGGLGFLVGGKLKQGPIRLPSFHFSTDEDTPKNLPTPPAVISSGAVDTTDPGPGSSPAVQAPAPHKEDVTADRSNTAQANLPVQEWPGGARDRIQHKVPRLDVLPKPGRTPKVRRPKPRQPQPAQLSARVLFRRCQLSDQAIEVLVALGARLRMILVWNEDLDPTRTVYDQRQKWEISCLLKAKDLHYATRRQCVALALRKHDVKRPVAKEIRHAQLQDNIKRWMETILLPNEGAGWEVQRIQILVPEEVLRQHVVDAIQEHYAGAQVPERVRLSGQVGTNSIIVGEAS